MQSLPAIAFVSVQSDPALENSSQSIYVRQLGEALSRLGWQIDMFTCKSDLNQADIVQHNPLCRTIRLATEAEDFIDSENLIGYLPAFLKQLRLFEQENELEYSLVHTNSWLSAWVGMELRKVQPIKHFHTYHSLGAVKYGYEENMSNVAKTRLAIEKTCLETADLTIATCPQQRDYLKELVSDKGSVEIVPCGTNTELFGSVARTSARKELEIGSNIFNILYVGKFDRLSGIETLIKAISKPRLHSLADIRLTLVDSSPTTTPLIKKRVEKQVWDLGLDNITTFVSGVTQEELPVYYAAADVCVVPSQYDPCGMVAMEAMASDTPVIAANLGGLKYAIEHEKTGLLFPSQNSFLLTKALSRLITEANLRFEISMRARERVLELFTWDDIANQLSEFYLEQNFPQSWKPTHNLSSYPMRAIAS